MNLSSNRVHFAISFPDIPDPLNRVWAVLVRFLQQHKCLPKTFEVSQIAGHAEEKRSEQYIRLSPSEIEGLIIERHLNAFLVTTGHSTRSVDYWFSNGLNVTRNSKLFCRIGTQAKAPDDWSGLIETLTSIYPVIGAWQWRHLYRCWQWADRVDEFYETRWGRLPPGYRTRAEPVLLTLTPQPDRILADISLNPGRPRELAPTVYFYPTAEMWLGPHFWQYAKCTKEEALAAGFWLETRDTPHHTYFKCWPTPFTRPDGDQGRMQQRLWKLFFHEDCEWPPGSGTICDEPMYGPPELMPQSPENILA